MTHQTLTEPTISVLYIGGTGTISAAAVRRSVEVGMHVSVLNRGVNAWKRSLPDGVVSIVADIRDPSSISSAIANRDFDVVVDFLSFTASDAEAAVELFGGRVRQYVQISAENVYRRPVLQVPLVESSARGNPFVARARGKIAAENALMDAFESDGFPVTIVRPAHTYDEVRPPLPGSWTVIERMARGDEVVVHGDGTSLWTLTHAKDFAVGLVGLLGNSKTIGEAFHITSDFVYTWDQIYWIIGEALGVVPRLVHVPSEFFPLVAPGWLWAELIAGDLSSSTIFDNSKIRRVVPEFSPVITLEKASGGIIEWWRANRDLAIADDQAEAIFSRLTDGYHQAREIFASFGERE